MADPEVLFCHGCMNEWTRDRNGLKCPECHSDCVEEIDNAHDPRENLFPDDDGDETSNRLSRLLQSHRHWNEPPGSDEGDIEEHVEWNTFPGIRFSRLSYRSSSPGMGSAGQRITDPFAVIQNFSTMMEGTARGQHQAGGSSRQNGSFRSPPRSPGPGPMPSFPHTHEHPRGSSGSAPGSPLREGLPGQGFGAGRSTYTATTRLWPRDGNTSPQHVPLENLQGLLGTILQTMNGMNQNEPNTQGPHGPIPSLHLFAQLFNPANAAHGDVVYSEEALDRVITQFMEQTHGSSAPGPASAEAISRLPKKNADKSMMGSDGKAECSVCMDNVEIGDEVTVLPCSHWFHGDCVGAWLKEHDTCPHCRQGIMPKDGGAQASSPRSPGQPPMNNSQPPPTPSPEGGRGLHFTWQQPVQQPPYRAPEPQSRQHHQQRRRSSAREGRNGGEGSSGGGGNSTSSGGFGGWVRDRLRGNSDRS